jgi:branched-chain amino acid transport system substrate-binding protein
VVTAATLVRAVAAAGALLIGLAACGGGDEPRPKLAAGTLTVGAVVVSERDQSIVDAARIAVGEVNDAGGIEGKVRLRLVVGADAGKLGRGGARVLVLPCDAGDEGRALGAVRGLRVLTFATCNNDPAAAAAAGAGAGAGGGTGKLPLTAPWGVGPDITERAAMLAAALHDRQFQRVAIIPGGAADFLRDAIESWGIKLVPEQAEAIVTDGDWPSVDRLRGFAVYGLDRLDPARGIRAARRGAEGRVLATFGFPVPGSELDELYEKYRLDHGARPDGSQVQLGYDAVRVLVEAVEEARSTDPAALSSALPGLEVSGAGGVLNYEENGSRVPRADAALVEVRNGRLELVKRGRPERP